MYKDGIKVCKNRAREKRKLSSDILACVSFFVVVIICASVCVIPTSENDRNSEGGYNETIHDAESPHTDNHKMTSPFYPHYVEKTSPSQRSGLDELLQPLLDDEGQLTDVWAGVRFILLRCQFSPLPIVKVVIDVQVNERRVAISG